MTWIRDAEGSVTASKTNTNFLAHPTARQVVFPLGFPSLFAHAMRIGRSSHDICPMFHCGATYDQTV
ncbi:hypothetical protein FRC08_012653, partial [Ceratobasidium sp. 394]